jgi:hypothetical protein
MLTSIILNAIFYMWKLPGKTIDMSLVNKPLLNATYP